MTATDQTSRKIVYVIDDNVDVRKSLHFALEAAGITVWPFAGPEDFLDALATLSPAPILLDVRMPRIDGVQLLQIIREREVNWPVIMMTAHGEIPVAVAAMKLGAADFLEKPFDLDALENFLDTAFSRLDALVAEAQRLKEARSRLASLSPRELDVAKRLALGETSKMVALNLGISHRTVEIHRAAVATKLGAKSTAGVVRLMVEAGEGGEIPSDPPAQPAAGFG